MEKDIVERLRAAEVEYEPAGVWEEERLNALFREAADEIERLQRALEKIAYPPDDIDAPHYPVSIARDVLHR